MDKEDLKPIVVKSTHEIRRAISPFIKDVKIGKVDVAGDVTWSDEDGKQHVSKVQGYSSDVSLRQNLLDGFEQVKSHTKLWNDMYNVLQEDEYGSVLPEPDVDEIYMPVDRIIKYRLGGKREGMTVVWELPDRKVVFDPYSKLLDEIMLGAS